MLQLYYIYCSCDPHQDGAEVGLDTTKQESILKSICRRTRDMTWDDEEIAYLCSLLPYTNDVKAVAEVLRRHHGHPFTYVEEYE